MIWTDLQKAFDNANHNVLSEKMEFIGLSEETIKWFKFYLSNKKFKVHNKDNFSQPGNLLWGVPQGSILGPLFFLLYINDMPRAVDCELLTVDCLIFQHKYITEIQTELNKNFRMLFDWFVDNKTKKMVWQQT